MHQCKAKRKYVKAGGARKPGQLRTPASGWDKDLRDWQTGKHSKS